MGGPRPAAWAAAVEGAPIYAGFAATGVCVALPGALLPLLLTRWHLGYGGGGRLFLCAWIGSSLGALLTGGARPAVLAISSLGLASALLGLAHCEAAAAWFWMFAFGTALGAAMTSMTLIRQAQTGHRGRDLVLLNLMWAAGACATPVLVVGALRRSELRPILYPLAVVFVLLAVWAGLQRAVLPDDARSTRSVSVGQARLRGPGLLALFRRVPPRLILLVALTTGVEASFGGWLSTYSQHVGAGLAPIVAAPTCFWGGLLLSRLFWSVAAAVATERWIVRGSLLLIAAAALLLLLCGHGTPLLLASACLGFGIGPTYPLLLARALRTHSDGGIFFLAGVSSACLPWLTGVVSSRFGSLGAGLLIPSLAAMLMAVLSFTIPLSGAGGDPAPA